MFNCHFWNSPSSAVIVADAHSVINRYFRWLNLGWLETFDICDHLTCDIYLGLGTCCYEWWHVFQSLGWLLNWPSPSPPCIPVGRLLLNQFQIWNCFMKWYSLDFSSSSQGASGQLTTQTKVASCNKLISNTQLSMNIQQQYTTHNHTSYLSRAPQAAPV